MPNISDFQLNGSTPPSPSAAHSFQHGSIRITLENSELWKSFHKIGTEMIITKHGRRMFPHCSIRLSGLQPSVSYVIMVDVIPVDSFKYKWKKKQWEVAGNSEPQPPCRTYIHPDSPAVGSHWMRQSLIFQKMKLTNNTLDQHGHIILHSMHRYLPRFHVILADSPYTVRWSPFQTFTFPETVFTAVTAYQNPKITKLKIDHNPFAKGFRRGGPRSQHERPSSKTPVKRLTKVRKTLCSSSPDLQRMPSTSQAEAKQTSVPQTLKGGHHAAWVQELDSSESLHTELLELQECDFSCEEQMVPSSTACQPNRFPLPSGIKDPADPLFHAPPPPLGQQQGYHGNAADWSQYPLFSYSCW
ncbi:T-box-containing protein TBX6L isoform X1 [Nothobranchius furzeri]|uniref:T-box gene 16 n=1 Tax=Nothobranchius furzeri TaxID=105023 RepID=A0A1A7ZYW0_NOTFU|nr:T-box-containing protein TBX6L-like [Nothobranchius furzeri]